LAIITFGAGIVRLEGFDTGAFRTDVTISAWRYLREPCGLAFTIAIEGADETLECFHI
jgi:hypothetical protein